MPPDTSDRDAALLLDMLLAARDAVGFVAAMDETAFLASRLHQNAVIRALEVLGEAAGKVSAGFRAAHPEIPWHETTAMRHRLIHGYAESATRTGVDGGADPCAPAYRVVGAVGAAGNGRRAVNAERLLAEYHRIADAADATARLRRFVLDLAVRGK